MNPETNQEQQEASFSSNDTANELMQMLEERDVEQQSQDSGERDEKPEEAENSGITNSSEEETSESELSAETEKQLECIDELADLPMTVTGGYAEEAALHGEVTREHHDIDFFAHRENADSLMTQLQERGYKVEPKAGPDGSPYKLLISKYGAEGDVVFLDQEQDTN